MSSGSSPSGETRYDWNDEMKPRWIQLMNNAGTLGTDGYQKFPVESRFAPLHTNQTRAIGNMDQWATALDSPAAAQNSAMRGITDVNSGKYLSGANSNPYAGMHSNPWVDKYRNEFVGQVNPWQNQSAQIADNNYKGDNPHARNVKLQGMADIVDSYERGTARDLKGQAVMSGAFGGSAHQDALSANQGMLSKGLSNYANQFDQGQYDRSAQLEENAINRSVQNQQFDKNLGGNWYDAMLGRGTQATEGLLTRGGENFNRSLDRGAQTWDSERNRMMQGIGLGQNENQNTLARIMGLMQTGQLAQDQNQKSYDFNFDQWLGEQNHPYKNVDFMRGLFGSAQGGTTNSTTMYPSNTAGQIGGGLLGLLAALG